LKAFQIKWVMYRHYPFLLIIMILSSLRSGAQPTSPELTLAYRKLLEFKTDSVRLLLDHQVEKDHDRAFKIYLHSLEDVLGLTLTRNDSLYGLYSQKEKDYIRDLDLLPENDPFTSFVKAEIRLHSAIIRLRYNDQFSGAMRLIQAYKMVHAMMDEQEVPIYVFKTAGVVNILFSLVPEKYDFWLRLIGVRPDLSTGIRQIEKLIEKKTIFSFEGSMILALLNAYYLNEPQKSVEHILTNNREWQNSLTYQFLSGLVFSKIRDNENSLQAFQHCMNFSGEYGEIPAVNFYLAESYMKKLEFAPAGIYYKRYLSPNNVIDFQKAANYRLYLISLFDNKSSLAERYRKNVINQGQRISEADKYVYSLVSAGYHPHPEIQKARLLFDGGYYEESLMKLETIHIAGLTDEEKLEYSYRKARVYQELKDFDTARKHYDEVFRTSFQDHYLMANAHLQMGYIELEAKNQEASADHFREALKYSGVYYKSSIRNEARAGLSLVQ
jgi:tetratricopeptide (TPR) repeat protein